MTWFKQYTSSLKNVDAEEPLDIYFYRPLAFIIVKTFYALPLTPNQYSLMAFISGMFSSYYFLQGTQAAFMWGAFYFLMFAIFDCCDGMLARMKRNGSEFGRLVDGAVDYSVNATVYTCLAIGVSKAYPGSGLFAPWVLVVLAGCSKALHSIIYDHYLTEYLAYAKGDGGFVVKEIKALEKTIEISKTDGSPLWRQIALQIYLQYSRLQAGNEGRILRFNPEEYCRRNLRLLKMWSFIGPAVHITFLILAFTLRMPSILFGYAILFGNLWLVLMFLYQQQVRVKLTRESLA